ncbi:MAG: DUF481 domain-containing protein [Bacteroidales bacterium]
MRQTILLIAGFLLILFPDHVRASKIDTIYFQKGDRVTGEVKSLESNHLRLSTNDVSTITIEWNKIDSVKILNNMRIVLENGEIFYGKLMPSGEPGSCYIWGNIGDPLLTPLPDIVLLSPLEEKFIDRLSGTLSSGFSYTKASDIMQVNLNGTVTYLAQKNQVELSYDGILTLQDTLEATQRQSGGVVFRRILPRNWFLASELNGESNSEQNLDLRTTFSFGGGNSVVNTNRTSLRVGVGLQATRELSGGDRQNSLEGLLGGSYSMFIYDSPEVTINISGKLSPSLSDLGRVRADTDSNIKWEVFHDFFLKWTFYYSFDSRPLSTTAEKNDWAVSLLGIEYKL